MPWNLNKNHLKYINKLSESIARDEITEALSAMRVLFKLYLQENRFFCAVYRNICENSLLLIQAYDEAVDIHQSNKKTATVSQDKRIHPAVEREEKDNSLAIQKITLDSSTTLQIEQLYQQIISNIFHFIHESQLSANKSFIKKLRPIEDNEFMDMLAVLELYFPSEFEGIKLNLPVIFDCVKFLEEMKYWESCAIIRVGEEFIGVPAKQQKAVVLRLIKHAENADDLLLQRRSQAALVNISNMLPKGSTAELVNTALIKLDDGKKNSSLDLTKPCLIEDNKDKATAKEFLELYQEEKNDASDRMDAALFLLKEYQVLISDDEITAVHGYLSATFTKVPSYRKIDIITIILSTFLYLPEHLKPLIAEKWINYFNNPIKHWIDPQYEKEIPQILDLIFDDLSPTEKNNLFNNLITFSAEFKQWNIDNKDSLNILHNILSKLKHCDSLLEKLQNIYHVSIKKDLIDSAAIFINTYIFIKKETAEDETKLINELQFKNIDFELMIVLSQLLNSWANHTTVSEKKLMIQKLEFIMKNPSHWHMKDIASYEYRRCLLQCATPNEDKLSDATLAILQEHYEKIMTELKPEPAADERNVPVAFYRINNWVNALGEKAVSELTNILCKRVSQFNYLKNATLALARLMPVIAETEQTKILSDVATYVNKKSQGTIREAVDSILPILDYLFLFNTKILTKQQARQVIAVAFNLLENRFDSIYVTRIVEIFIAFIDYLTNAEKMKIATTLKQHIQSEVGSDKPQQIDIDRSLGLFAQHLTPLQRKYLIHNDMREIFYHNKKWDLRHTKMMGSILKINSLDQGTMEAIKAKEALLQGGYLIPDLITIVQQYLLPATSADSKMLVRIK